MPELPEVETVRRGIAPHITGKKITGLTVRNHRLRRPVWSGLARALSGRPVQDVGRRAKYLLLTVDGGCLLVHLGMSGSLRILTHARPPGAHDHVDFLFGGRLCLRFCDPRRFGCMVWTARDPLRHPLLRDAGPEPLGDGFSGATLFRKSRGRSGAVKSFVMDGRVVAGVGNIYASEALFRAGIHPLRPAGRIAAARYDKLAFDIKTVLAEAITAGGTTLRDFVNSTGDRGYFTPRLQVYDRAGLPCPRCSRPLRRTLSGQRSTFYCGGCQR